MKVRRGLGPRHTAPVHRQTGVFAGDQTATPPLRVGRNGAYEVATDETLEVDSRGRLRVSTVGVIDAASLAGESLEAIDGALRVGVRINKVGVTASGAYVQSEIQAISDKLDELIGLLQDERSRTT